MALGLSSSASSGAQMQVVGAADQLAKEQAAATTAANQIAPASVTIGNTTYYSTVEEWRAAGSPGGDGVHNVIIGTPPTPTEPAPTQPIGGGTTSPPPLPTQPVAWSPDFTQPNPYAGAPPEYIQSIYGTPAYNSAVAMGWIQPIGPPPGTPSAPSPTPTPSPTPVPGTGTTIGNTTYYPSVDAWRAAGSPAGDGIHNIIIGTPPVTTIGGTSGTPTQPTGAWKPDFTQPNPYAGMPPDYPRLVASGFVPTPSNPLSPVQIAAITGQISGGMSNPIISQLSPAQQALLGVKSLNDLTSSQVAAIQQGKVIPLAPTSPGVTLGTSPSGVQVTGATFRPDFTKANPYEGMPAEYAVLVAQSFVPTITNPLNPVQVAALTGQTQLTSQVNKLTVQQQRLLGAATVDALSSDQKLAVRSGQTIPIITPTTNPDVKEYERRFDVYSQQKAEYDSSILTFDAKWNQWIKDNLFVGTPEQFAEYKSEAGKIQLAGIDLSMQFHELLTREKIINQKQAEELAKYIRIDDKTYILKTDWDALPQDSRDLIQSKGYQAYTDWVKQLQDTHIAVIPSGLMAYDDVVGSSVLSERTKATIISLYYPQKYDLYVQRGGKSLEELGIDKAKLAVPTVNAYQWLQNFPAKESPSGFDLAAFFRTIYNDAGSTNDAEALLRSLNISQKDIQSAKVAAFTSTGSMAVTDNVQRPNIIDRASAQLNNWVETSRGEAIQRAGTISNTLLRDANLGASGVLVAGVSMVPQMVLMPATIITHPEQLLPMTKGMVDGTIQSVKMLNPAAMANPFDIAVSTFNIGMIADMARGPVMKVVSFVSPHSLPVTMTGIEYSTAHIPTSKVEYAAWLKSNIVGQLDTAKLNPEAVAAALDKAIIEAVKKPEFFGTKSVLAIPIEGTDLKMTVLFTPLQRELGQSLFHGTNEGVASFGLEKPIKMIDAKAGSIDPVAVKEVNGILTGDKFDAQGGLIKTADGYENPTVGGLVRRRVTDVVTDNTGRVLLVTDRMEPKGFYGLPGGDLIAENLAPGSTEGGIRYPIEAFADMQLSSETGVGLVDGSTQRLPSYLGQANRHSLPGTYVVIGKADGASINLAHYIEDTLATAKKEGRDLTPDEVKEINRGPELSDAVWWDGKTPIEVSPATYDILAKLTLDGKLTNLDISKLTISKATPVELLTARDPVNYRPTDLSVGGVTQVLDKMDTGYKELTAPKGGLYKTPWMAPAYTRGGLGQAAYLWEIVDPETFKVPANRAALSESQVFIRNAKPGEYLPSKLYQGTLEPEVVSAEGTKIIIPEPNTDLQTRVLTGKAADFSIYQDGKYVPVQMGIQPELLASGKFEMPSPAKLYAVKLLAFDNAIRNIEFALKHPDIAVRDIIGNIEATIKHPTEALRGDTATSIPTPGLREIYIERAKTDFGARINQLSKTIQEEATRILKDEGKTITEDAMREAEDRAFARNMSGLIAQYTSEVNAYNTDQLTKQRLEDLYATSLSYSVEAMTNYDMLERQTINEIYKTVYPESTIRTPEAVAREVTPIAPRQDEVRLVEPRAVEPPVEPRPQEPRPLEPRPVEPRPLEPRPTEPRPLEPRPMEPIPVEPRPTEPRPLEPRPIELRPIEPRPLEPRPIEPRPIEPRPIEPRPYEPFPITPKPPQRITLTELPADWSKTGVPKGTIEWRQGRKWVALPPPYKDENKLYLDNPLPGTYKFSTGKGSAYRTLQVINGTGAEDADIDMGWAQVHVRSKGRDLEMTFAGGQDAANDRWAMEQQMMDAYEQQAYANMPQGDYTERIPRQRQPVSGQPSRQFEVMQPPSLNKTEIPEFSTDGVKVFSVNGAFIRNKYANQSIGDRDGVDFMGGGHSGVYWKIIPADEIWIENNLQGEDRDAFILHELEEREQMLTKGMDYSEAHNDYANKVEVEGRKNPHELDEMIAGMIEKYHKEQEPPEAPRRVNGRTKQAQNAGAIPRRTYLGYPLRPVELS